MQKRQIKIKLKYYFPADAFEVAMVTEKFKTHKSPDIDQIPAEFIKAGGRTIRCEIQNLLIISGIRRNFLKSGRSR